MTFTTFKTNFEKQLLLQFILDLRKGRIKNSAIRNMSKEFVAVLSNESSIDGFINRISRVAQSYPQVREAFIATMKEYEEITVAEQLANVRGKLNIGGGI